MTTDPPTEYIPPRHRHLPYLLVLFLLPASGCESSPKIVREQQFGPAKVRLHPTFTQVKDWTGDNHPDGIEAVVELLDSFDEPTKGSGTLVFELSEYRPQDPQMAFRRQAEPWQESLVTREQQTAHWSA